MSFPVNAYTQFQALLTAIAMSDLLETRIVNNGSGQPIYIGKNLTPNADPAASTWSLLKITYDGSGYLTRVQLPDNGQGYLYVFNDYASYFS